MQQQPRLTGQGAGVEKYDLITALAANGLAAGGSRQTTMLRLIAVLTARYNWTQDEVTIGQKEMAALWAVDERTAKRETRRLIEAGLLMIKRPGIRGRVAAYQLDRRQVYHMSTAEWRNVGPDFEARMGARQPLAPSLAPSAEKVVHIDFKPRAGACAAGLGPWQKTLARLALDYPHLFDAWFHQLQAELPDQDQILHIQAPTKFIASYVANHLMVNIERAARLHYGSQIRCLISARAEPNSAD